MTAPQGLGEMRDLLSRHGLTPRKALGQHFLSDPNIVRRIVRLSEVDESSNVLEIGGWHRHSHPGPGRHGSESDCL